MTESAATHEAEREEEAAARPPPSRRRTVIVLVAVLAALSISGGVALWHFFLRAPTPRLSRFAPKDAELYVEVVDVKRFALSIATSDAIATEELDADEQLARLAGALADGFALDDAEVEKIFASVESVALVGRNLEPIGERFERRPEAAVIVRFTDGAALAAVRESARFDEASRFFGAEELTLKPPKKLLEGEPRHWGDLLARSLQGVGAEDAKSARAAQPVVVVLVPAENLLVVGARELAYDVGRVAAGDKSSLDESERFRAASWKRGAQVVAFYEPTVSVTARASFFHDVPAWTGAAWVSSEGLVTTARATFRGDAIDEDASLPAGSKLEVVARLPRETFAYVALSTEGEGSAKERARDLSALVDALDPSAGLAFHHALLWYERELGGTLPLLFEALGRSAVVGVAADEVPAPSTLGSVDAFFDHATIVGIVEVGDVDAAEKVVSDVRAALERETSSSHTAEGVPGGFELRPRKETTTGRQSASRTQPTLRVTIEGRAHVLVLIGRASEVEDFADAFSSSESIDAGGVHEAARGVLPGSLNALAWADAGGLLAAELAGDKAVRRAFSETGVPIGALRLEGRRRLTAAAGLVLSRDAGGVEVETTSLNAPLSLALFGLLSGGKVAPPKPTKEAPKALDDATGIPECDDYLKAILACAKDAPDAVRGALLQSAATFRDSIKNTPDPLVMGGVCSTARKALKESGSCD